MKKYLFMLLTVLIGFSSCTENEIVVKVETVPCTFHPSSITADVDDKPMTRAISTDLRTIHYYIDYSDTLVPDLQGTVLENSLLELELAKDKQFTYYFVYDDDMNELSNNLIRINSSATFRAQKTMTITNPVNESVVLTRESSNFVVKKGKIPEGTTLHAKVRVKNQFNWKTGNKPHNSYTEEYNNPIESAYSYWMLGSETDNIEVTVMLKNINNKVVKSATYLYTVAKNHIKTVTYNINNVNGNTEDFFVSIDDSPMIGGDDSNQQIGK